MPHFGPATLDIDCECVSLGEVISLIFILGALLFLVEDFTVVLLGVDFLSFSAEADSDGFMPDSGFMPLVCSEAGGLDFFSSCLASDFGGFFGALVAFPSALAVFGLGNFSCLAGCTSGASLQCRACLRISFTLGKMSPQKSQSTGICSFLGFEWLSVMLLQAVELPMSLHELGVSNPSWDFGCFEELWAWHDTRSWKLRSHSLQYSCEPSAQFSPWDFVTVSLKGWMLSLRGHSHSWWRRRWDIVPYVLPQNLQANTRPSCFSDASSVSFVPPPWSTPAVTSCWSAPWRRWKRVNHKMNTPIYILGNT